MLDRHVDPDEEAREWASLYALGVLASDERVQFEAHMRGCAVCAAEVESFDRVAGRIGLAVRPGAPTASLRERVLARAAAPSRKPGVLLDRGGLFMARSGDLQWRPGISPGVDARILFRDAARRYITALVRLAPAAVYPGHRHTEVEALYVLEGDLEVEGVSMRAGDYCRGDDGSIHGDSHSQNGCVFLVTFSEQDEILAPG